jgi:integrase/recombinase XerD
MTLLRQRMMHDLQLKGYAESTQSKYINAIKDFAKFHDRSPSKMGQEEVRQWVEHLNEGELSPQRLRQHYAALVFLYRKTLGQPEAVSFLSSPREKERLPEVLSPEEVSRVLQSIIVFKYRVFCTTLYATGMRISEACMLETSDIDAARGVILVRKGKGNRERLVGLPTQLLELLRRYWKVERPPAPWLFASHRGGPIKAETVREALADAGHKAGVTKRVTPHVLRHCFATHMIENGTDLRVIQVLLGHKSIESTTRYTQVSAGLIAKTNSPLLLLDEGN